MRIIIVKVSSPIQTYKLIGDLLQGRMPPWKLVRGQLPQCYLAPEHAEDKQNQRGLHAVQSRSWLAIVSESSREQASGRVCRFLHWPPLTIIAPTMVKNVIQAQKTKTTHIGCVASFISLSHQSHFSFIRVSIFGWERNNLSQRFFLSKKYDRSRKIVKPEAGGGIRIRYT